MTYHPNAPTRVLTLWQPWASLMDWGEKRNETRGWPTNYRGWVAIHAAIKQAPLPGELNPEILDALRQHKCTDETGDPAPWRLPRGYVLCLVYVTGCLPVEHSTAPAKGSREYAFGDYTPGRYFWTTEHRINLARPVPHVGGQGLRFASLALCAEIAAAID